MDEFSRRSLAGIILRLETMKRDLEALIERLKKDLDYVESHEFE